MRAAFFFVAISLVACQSPPEPGAACARSTDCPAPLSCAYGRCRAQCAANRDCPIGSECLLTAPGIGACALPTRDMCDLVSLPCVSGLACTGSVCRQTCDTLPCAAGSTCTSSTGGLVCVATDQDAGPPVDVGTDAGQSGPSDSGPTGGASHLGAGQTHFCAVMANGTLYCWGSSSGAELGDRQTAHGDCTTCSALPVQALDRHMQPLTGVSAVSGGPAYTCAIVSGQVQCWGQGAIGVAALFTTDPVTPLDTSGAPLAGATSIVGALDHACATVGASGDVWCWGLNGDGRLGDGSTNDSRTPVRATELGSMLRGLAMSQHHTVALDASGAMLGVGGNSSFELGVMNGPIIMAVRPPLPAASAIATSGGVTCIVREDTDVLGCFGDANGGALIDPMTTACPDGLCSLVLHEIPLIGTMEHAVSVAITNAYFGTAGVAACVLTDAGNVYCMGAPAFASSPTQLSLVTGGMSSVEELVSSDSAFCARTHSGEVWCWGDDVNGQLGRGAHDDGAFLVPERVMLPQ